MYGRLPPRCMGSCMGWVAAVGCKAGRWAPAISRQSQSEPAGRRWHGSSAQLAFSRWQSALPAVPAFAGVSSRAGKSVWAVSVGSTLRIPGRVARIGGHPGRRIAVRTRNGHTLRREEYLGHTRIVLAKTGPRCRSLQVLLANASCIAIGVHLAGAGNGCRHGEHGHDESGEEEAHGHFQAAVRDTPMMPERYPAGEPIDSLSSLNPSPMPFLPAMQARVLSLAPSPDYNSSSIPIDRNMALTSSFCLSSRSSAARRPRFSASGSAPTRLCTAAR